MNLYNKLFAGGLVALLSAGLLSTFGNFPNDSLTCVMNAIGGICFAVGLIGTCIIYSTKD